MPVWAPNDEVDVKLIETATASFDAATYDRTEGDSFDVTEDAGSEAGWSIVDSFDIESGGSWSAHPDGKSLLIQVRATPKAGPPVQAHRADRHGHGQTPDRPVLDRAGTGRRR